MKTKYREMFDRVRASERLRKEVMEMTKREEPAPKRRVPRAALIAAALALALAGTAIAAVNPSLQNWFSRRWSEMTGGEISEGQAIVIDSLTQEVGESVTDGNITVTVDSLTAGGSQIWALVDVTGWEFEPKTRYSFDRIGLEVTPDPSEGEGGSAGYSLESIGVTGDGTCRMLLQYSSVISTGSQISGGGYTLELRLHDLIRCRTRHNGEDTVLVPGEWSFSIPLTSESQPAVILLGDARVTAFGTDWKAGDPVSEELEERHPVPLDLTGIRLSATGVSFYSEEPLDGVTLYADVTAILADGTEVPSDGVGGSRLEDGTWYSNFDWPVPVDLDQAAALRIGDTEIPLK